MTYVYGIGQTSRFAYTAKGFQSGLALQLYAIAVKPDQTIVPLTIQELNNGLDSRTRGIYYADITFDQDGAWIIKWDTIDANSQYRRPDAMKAIVDTQVRNGLVQLGTTLVQDIDTELTANHGAGNWTVDENNYPQVNGSAFP